jgi:CxxC motif-containing protein (DUF1111 family)
MRNIRTGITNLPEGANRPTTAAYVSGQPLRLLHDGRARSVEEAILWHDSEARRARDTYSRLTKEQRRVVLEWIQDL